MHDCFWSSYWYDFAFMTFCVISESVYKLGDAADAIFYNTCNYFVLIEQSFSRGISDQDFIIVRIFFSRVVGILEC